MDDSISLALFFQQRVYNTVKHAEYIGQVEVGFRWDDTFGNEYIKVEYLVSVNDCFSSQAEKEQETINATFTGSPFFIYSISTHRQRYPQDEGLTFVSFQATYNSLAAYVVAELSNALDAEVPIKVKSAQNWPKANLAKQYYSYLDRFAQNRYYWGWRDIETESQQLESLFELTQLHAKRMLRQPKRILVKEESLLSYTSISRVTLRGILLKQQIPVRWVSEYLLKGLIILGPSLIEGCITILQDPGEKWYWDECEELLEILYYDFFPKALEKLT
ncbi:MAG TPA: hypothetical protein DCR93_29065 [Cytophagales bacterium]|nr:hypothetical protein [Cytophagales bacterium]HAP63380.1 hypothetical protein [Cytophagales bacterium]